MLFRTLGVLGKRFVQAFLPSKIAGLQLWLDATDTDTINAKMSADFTSANTEYLSSASSDFDKGNESFSWGCWVNPDNISGANLDIFSKIDSTTFDGFNLYVNGANNNYHAYIDNGATGTAIDSGSTAVNGTWAFVVAVYDADADLLKISVNGNTFVTGANSTGSTPATADLMLANSGIGGRLLDGQIDGAFFYDKALSQAEVTTLYNSGNGQAYEDVDTVSLVSYWELNETSGNRSDAHGTNTLTDNNTVGSALGKIQEPIANNEYVWRWVDKSDNAFNIDQNTASDQAQYINTKELVFDGASDFYNIDSVLTPLASTNAGTWCAWVKPVDATPISNEIFICFGDTNANNAILMSVQTGGELRLYVADSATNAILLLSDSPVFANNTWCHVAITQDGTSGVPKMYVNGALESATDTGVGTGNEWFNDIAGLDNGRLGCANFVNLGDVNHFEGSIAEPLIYDSALDANQISKIYNYNLANYS